VILYYQNRRRETMEREVALKDRTGVTIKPGCKILWVGARSGIIREGKVLRVYRTADLYGSCYVDLQDPTRDKPSIGTKAYGHSAYVLYTPTEGDD
jgi:hypothetical protein